MHPPRRPIVFAALVLATPTAAPALDIVTTFDAGSSVANSFDPTGAGLISLVNHVVAYYEDTIHDTHTLNLSFWYEDLTGTALARAGSTEFVTGRITNATLRVDTNPPEDWFIDPTPNSDEEFTMTQTLWRDLSASTQTDWYTVGGGANIPETLEVSFAGTAIAGGDAEDTFDMLTVIYHEIGHALGLDTASDLTANEAADGNFNVNSNLVNGQTFAVQAANSSGDSTPDDSADGAHIEANTLMNPTLANDVRARPSHTDMYALSSAHDYTSLVLPRREFYNGTNWHTHTNWSGGRYPDPFDFTDVFIRDAQGSSTTLNVELQVANGHAIDLTIAEGNNFNTNGHTLFALDDVTVTDNNSSVIIGLGGEIQADRFDVLNNADVTVRGGTINARRIELDLLTNLTFDSGNSFIEVTDKFVNNGIITLINNATVTFLSTGAQPWDLDGGVATPGIIDANDGNLVFSTGTFAANAFQGRMTIGQNHSLTTNNPWSIFTADIHLNGYTKITEAARLNGAEITFTSGNVRVTGHGHINAPFVQTGGSFNLDDEATLIFNNNPDVSGGTYVVGHDATVQFNHFAVISGNPFFNLQGPTSDDGAVIFNFPARYEGGTITYNGYAEHNGSVSVFAPTTVNAQTFDMDGPDDAGPIYSVYDHFTVNANTLDEALVFFHNTVDADFWIDHNADTGADVPTYGLLEVNVPGAEQWLANGTTTLQGSQDAALPPQDVPAMIDGTPFYTTDTLNVHNRARVITEIGGLEAVINLIGSQSELILDGGNLADPNFIFTTTVTGEGTLTALPGHALHGHGEIASRINFIGNSNLLALGSGVVLNITGSIEDVGIIGTANDESTLNVLFGWNTNVADQLRLNGGTVTGAIITNGFTADPGLITGHGTVAASNVINNGTIAADGGELVLDYTNAPDLDGSGSGVIQALTGDLTIADAPPSAFIGTAEIGPTFTMTFQSGWTLSNFGMLNFFGGPTLPQAAVLDGAAQTLDGVINVDRIACILAPTTFGSNAVINVPDPEDQLVFHYDFTLPTTVTVNGNGSIAGAIATSLTIPNGTTLDYGVANHGTLHIGTSRDVATIAALHVQPTGILHIDMRSRSGPGGGGGETGGDPFPPVAGVDYDQLTVTGQVTLDGTLELDTNITADPLLGFEYPVLFYTSRTGMFDAITGNLIHPALALAPIFTDPTPDPTGGDLALTPGSLTFIAAVPGDLNLDNKVSVADLSTFALHFNTTPGLYDEDTMMNSWQLGDFNTDGAITVADLSLLALNFGFDATDPANPLPGEGLSLLQAATLAGISPTDVPEPSTICFGVVIIASCPRRTRRSMTTRHASKSRT